MYVTGGVRVCVCARWYCPAGRWIAAVRSACNCRARGQVSTVNTLWGALLHLAFAARGSQRLCFHCYVPCAGSTAGKPCHCGSESLKTRPTKSATLPVRQVKCSVDLAPLTPTASRKSCWCSDRSSRQRHQMPRHHPQRRCARCRIKTMPVPRKRHSACQRLDWHTATLVSHFPFQGSSGAVVP